MTDTKTSLFDLNAVRQLLEGEHPVTDEQFNTHFYEVSGLIEKDEYQEAAQLIRDQFDEGPIDIRHLMYYFYACFAERGLSCCEEMFSVIDDAIDTYWETMSPSVNRDQHAKKALGWLFARIVKNCEFISRAMGHGNLAPMSKCTLQINKKGIEKAVKSAYKLNETLEAKWNEKGLSDMFMHVVKWIKEFAQIAFERENAERAPKNVTPQPPPTAPVEEKPVEPVKKAKSKVGDGDEEISDAMRLLQRKLDAFESLVDRRDYKKAAIIADDIERLLENFNPLLYFPKLFVRHFSLYARISNKLDDNRDGGDYKILEKLFQANLDAFLEWRG